MSRQHARWSPSTLEKKSQCVRYDSVDSTDAGDEGTMLHEAVEKESLTGLDQEQKDSVQMCIGYKNNIKAGRSDKCQEFKEVKVELVDLTFGLVDVLLIDGDVADVMDWKFGRKVVTEAELNFQLLTYVSAVFEMHPELQKITGHLVSPRLKVITTHTWDRSIVPIVRARIEALYATIANPFTPPTPCDDTCGLCKWASSCPALGQVAVTVARGVGLPMPGSFAPDALVSVEDRSLAQMIASSLETWCEQIKKNNTKFVQETGGEIPGYGLISRSTGKRIPKEATMLALLRIKENGYATEDQVASAMTISIPELAKVMTAVRGTKETEEKDKMMTFLADVVQEGNCSFLQKIKAKKAKELKA